MLKAIGVNKFARSVLILLSVVPLAMSQTGAVRSGISTQSVADALTAAGISVSSGQVEFLSGGSKFRESARVRVLSATQRPEGTVKVKLRCQDNHECMPFYVLVHGLDTVELKATEVRALPAPAASAPQNVIHGGDHAMLILESADSRMSLPVICLQSGVRGQTIRVASPDHRQVYEAKVVAPGMLKGSL